LCFYSNVKTEITGSFVISILLLQDYTSSSTQLSIFLFLRSIHFYKILILAVFFLSRPLQFFLSSSSLPLSFPLLFAWSRSCSPQCSNGFGTSVHNVVAMGKAGRCNCLLPTGRDNRLLSRPHKTITPTWLGPPS
jgi:hypothetical protein